MANDSHQMLVIHHEEATTKVRALQKGICALRDCDVALKRNHWETTVNGRLVGLLCEQHGQGHKQDGDWEHLFANPFTRGLEILPREAPRWKRPGMPEAGDPPLDLDLTRDPAYAAPHAWFGKGRVLEVLFVLQRRRCPICQRPLRFGTGRSGSISGVHADHGLVQWEGEEVVALRGVLCARCNGNLGKEGLHWWWWDRVRTRRDAHLICPPAFAWDSTRKRNYQGLRSSSRLGGFTREGQEAITAVLLDIAGNDPRKRQVAKDKRWFSWPKYAGTEVHALLVEQAGRSAISGQRLNPPLRSAPGSALNGATLDHTGPSHQEGQVRGLITVSENARLTYEREASGKLGQRERAYLDNPPAQRLPGTRDLCYSKASHAWLTDARPLPPRMSATQVRAAVANARRSLREWCPASAV
jgi:hypothetical protein